MVRSWPSPWAARHVLFHRWPCLGAFQVGKQSMCTCWANSSKVVMSRLALSAGPSPARPSAGTPEPSSAWFRLTISAPPKPKSVRSGPPLQCLWPLTTTRKIQRRAGGVYDQIQPVAIAMPPGAEFLDQFLCKFAGQGHQKYQILHASRNGYGAYRRRTGEIAHSAFGQKI